MPQPPSLGRRHFLACVLGAAAKPQLARGSSAVVAQPFVQNIRESAATVRWATDARDDAVVEIQGPDGFSWSSAVTPTEFDSGSGAAQQYSARVQGLKAGVEYNYRIRANGGDLAAGTDYAFRTPVRNQGFRFLALGDSGWGSSAQRELAELMRKDRPAVVVHTGDLAYPSATFRNLKTKYLDVYQAQMRRVPFFPSLGNHDYWDNGEAVCRRTFDVPRANAGGEPGLYYSFDWGDVHFIALDTNTPLEMAARGYGQMLRWLEADLAATQKFWRVAFFHHPPYAAGPNWSDPLTRMAEAHIVPILERYNVPLVLNGHEHSYQRTYPMRGGQVTDGGTVYVTTGGGGADLYATEARPWIASRATLYHYVRFDVEGRKMKLTAIGRDGATIDTAEVTAAPALSGVMNGAGTAPIGAGGLVSLFGWQLAMRERTAGGDVLPRKPTDLQIAIGDQEVPLTYESPNQLNALLPSGITGVQTLHIWTPTGDLTREIEILPVAPAIFPGGVFEDSRQITPESPCRSGNRLSAFLTGAANVEGEVRVSLGGATVSGRIDPFGSVQGVQRVQFQVPDGVGGIVPLRVDVAGVTSNVVPVAVSAQ